MDEFEALALAAAAKKKRGERVGLGSRIMRGIKAFNDFSAGTQDAAMDGLTFGLADEMNAAAGSLTQPYGEALDAARTRQDEFAQKHPVVSTAANVGGAMVLPGGAASGVLRSGNLASRAAKSGAVAGSGGTAYGFNEGEGGAESRLENAKSVGAISTLIGSAVPVAGFAAGKVVQRYLERRAKDAAAKGAPAIAQLRAEASAAFEAAQKSGVEIEPKAYEDLVDDIFRKALKKGLDADLTPGAATAASRMRDEIGKAVGIEDMMLLREKVAIPRGNFANPREQAIASDMVAAVDDFITNLSPSQITAGNAAKLGETLGKARDMWSRMRKSEMLAEAVEKARSQASGFENGLRIQFRSILNSKKKRAQLTPDELKAVTEVVRGTFMGNALKLVGKFGFMNGNSPRVLMPGLGVSAGAATLGPAGAAMVPIAGQAAQMGAERVTRKAAERASGIVAGGGNVALPNVAPTMRAIESFFTTTVAPVVEGVQK